MERLRRSIEKERTMARELIDTHQHLWVMSERAYSWIEPAYGPLYDDFTPERLAPEIPASGVTGSVLVQAADTYDDTFYMLDVACAHREGYSGTVRRQELACQQRQGGVAVCYLRAEHR